MALSKRKPTPMRPLLFIDANILLDFYRSRNDAGISLLTKIDALHSDIITTCQLEMEFKKNRQKVISDSVALLKPPDFNLSAPAFLSEAATVKVIKKRIVDVKKRVEKLKIRVLSTLENPKTHDRIYQTTQRLFNNPSPLNLMYETPEYRRAWKRALRRFLEGRPPRKRDDTSAGDAINWEWIVECVKANNRDVIVVSRDADYGLTYGGSGYANNWLAEELKERTNQQRKIILVDRLSTALTFLDVEVTQEEIISEKATLKPAVIDDEDEVIHAIGEAMHDLPNEKEVSSLIATTNAFGWGLDVFTVSGLSLTNDKWTAEVTFSLSGEQDEEKPWNGDMITGHCFVEIDRSKNVTISDIGVELEEELMEDR